MFESAELGHKIDKQTYKKEVPALRSALQDAQYDLKENGKIPVVVLVSGQDGAGKGETINILYEWMDPRFISTLAFSAPTDEERERPFMWRYWRALPPKGRIGVFAGSWYSSPIHDRLEGHMSKADLDARIDQINRFEAMLVNEGALVLKFWFHLTKDGQKRRLKALEKDPHTAWRVTKWNWERLKTYDKLQDVVGHVLRMTNTPWSPWIIVEGEDDRYRSLTAGKILLKAIRERLSDVGKLTTPVAPPVRVNIDGRNVLSELNLGHKLSEAEYDAQLAKWQGKLSELVRDPRFKGRSLVCAFEGADAAGKGGAIRRITAAMDARPALPVALLAPYPAPRPRRDLRPHLVRPRAGRARRGFLLRGRLAARLYRNQRFRARPCRRRRHRRQVLAADQSGRAVAPLQGTREDRIQALQDHRGRLAQSREVGCLPGSHLRHGRPHQHRHCALDPGRSQRQGLCPREGAAHHLRTPRGRAGGQADPAAEARAGGKAKEGKEGRQEGRNHQGIRADSRRAAACAAEAGSQGPDRAGAAQANPGKERQNR
jgi:polyphosphate kinase 2 (PPK2 family)